jgi:hypothetical protein
MACSLVGCKSCVDELIIRACHKTTETLQV